MKRMFLPPFTAMTVAAAAMALNGPAAAKDENGQNHDLPQVLSKLAECRALADDAERLACYDRESGSLISAADKGEVKVIDKAEAKEMRRSLFGFSLPKIALFGGDEASDDIMQTTITDVSTVNGKYRLTIAEGATWQLTESPYYLRRPKAGDQVEFKKATFGSYFVRINGQTGVKGYRVN